MSNLERAELEPIERASVEQLRALQLERMQWTLRHAYDNVAHFRQSFDAAGVKPKTCCWSSEPPEF